MLRRSQRVACTAYWSPGGESHRLISKYHHELTNPRAWELSTPSRALPVLDVLADSGVLVDGVAWAAEPSLRSMAPCLTHAELSMLGKVASFFSTSRSLSSTGALSEQATGSASKSPSANELVRRLYLDVVETQGPRPIPETMTTDSFLGNLTLVEATMLLELFLSAARSSSTAPREESISKLVRSLTSLLSTQASLQFDVVLSLLLSMRDWPQKDEVPRRGVLTSLSASCARHVHQHLPDVTMQQHVTLYLLLAGVPEKPFIVLKAMEDHMLTHADDFTGVPTPIMLAVMSTPFAQQHPSFLVHLSILWYYEDRVTDMTSKESLLALHILVHIHMIGGDVPVQGATSEEWQLVHDYLFAQLFSFARHFSLIQCVAVFDALEIMNASPCSVLIPLAFAEKVKKRAFVAASGIAKRAKTSSELDQALEAFLYLEAALRRCGVLPFTESDGKLCVAIQTALHQAAVQNMSATSDSCDLK